MESDSIYIFRDKVSEKNFEYFNKLYDREGSAILYEGTERCLVFDNSKGLDNYIFNERKVKCSSDKKVKKILKKYTQADIIADLELYDSIDVPFNYNFVSSVPKSINFTNLLGANNVDSINLKTGGWEPRSNTYITVYEHANYGGSNFNCIDYYTSTEQSASGTIYKIADFNTVGLNDEISSIRVGNDATRGLFVAFYETANFTGSVIAFFVQPKNGYSYFEVNANRLEDFEWRPCFFCSKKNWKDRISAACWFWEEPHHNDYAARPNWGNKTNVHELTDHSLYKNGSTGWYNSGAISNGMYWLNPPILNSTLKIQDGGFVEVEIASLNTEFMLGFTSYYGLSPAYSDIRYAMNNSDYFYNTVRCYNYGTYSFSSSISYDIGDILRMDFKGGYINVYLNSVTIGRFYHGNTNDTFYVDCSLNENGSILPTPLVHPVNVYWNEINY